MTGKARPLELWGGVECTVNRVGDRYADQVRRTGHDARPEDLERFAALGFRTLRYPVLWERVAPDGLDRAEWRWTDDRLHRLRALGIRPVAGLIHHGSGPRGTSLLDPAFPDALSAYAAAVARRYPWLEDYTPVNEPLTTARFSALYGHWYPHGQDPRAFVGALINQVDATVRAMRAIRTVNPRARLIQTEDAGRTFSTPLLAYQARFENHRRWLTFDLLAGRVGRQHPLWRWLLDHAAPRRTLDALVDSPCASDVIGLNYYLTSDRYLDERVDRYPGRSPGGNGRHTYVDVEAVRAMPSGIAGHRRVLRDAWHRYGVPLAITEAHAGCTREDQVRWLLEAWEGAAAARADGADVRAVTVWALLGSFDWCSLVCRDDGVYEPGAFDVRSNTPRLTALGRLARALAAQGVPDGAIGGTGWWRRPERLTAAADVSPVRKSRHCGASAPPIVIAGAGGTLGSAIARACAARGLPHLALSRQDCDITEPGAVSRAVQRLRPWAVINAAGHVRVDAAEGEPDACLRLNADGAAALAGACAGAGVRFVTFSSDLVFDGELQRPYVEEDAPRPLSVYGLSKLEAERRVLEVLADALVIRTSAFFGPVDRHNFVTLSLQALARGERVLAAQDVVVSPTYVPDLADATLDLLLDGERGVWHLANAGQVTWYELAARAARAAGLDVAGVTGVPMQQLGWRAPRPAFSALSSSRGRQMPDLESALARYLRDTAVPRAAIVAAR